MGKKLELSQLKNYLGTEVKSYKTFNSLPLIRELDYSNIAHFIYNETSAKLMFYRLSDLDKFIPELGFVPLDRLFPYDYKDQEEKALFIETTIRSMRFGMNVPFNKLTKLFEWHFWVFDQSYFEEGLIIDKLKQS